MTHSSSRNRFSKDPVTPALDLGRPDQLFLRLSSCSFVNGHCHFIHGLGKQLRLLKLLEWSPASCSTRAWRTSYYQAVTHKSIFFCDLLFVVAVSQHPGSTFPCYVLPLCSHCGRGLTGRFPRIRGRGLFLSSQIQISTLGLRNNSRLDHCQSTSSWRRQFSCVGASRALYTSMAMTICILRDTCEQAGDSSKMGATVATVPPHLSTREYHPDFLSTPGHTKPGACVKSTQILPHTEEKHNLFAAGRKILLWCST